LYTSIATWNHISSTNKELLKDNYDYTAFAKAFTNKVVSTKDDLYKESKQDFLIKMLNYHSNREYKYLSRWIGLKNQL
jgi:hypothetical protein